MVSAGTAQFALDDGSLDVLRRAPLAHVGVQGAQGPHVTPQAFVWFMERLWLLTPRSSFKAVALAKRPAAGVLMEHDGVSLYISGPVSVLDPLDPSSLMADPVAAVSMPAAFTAYLRKNIYESISAARRSFGWDVLSMPATRVALAVTPERSALIGADGLLHASGDWTTEPAATERRAPEETLDLNEIPDEIGHMAVDGKHIAVVGWGGSGAPLLMQGCWNGVTESVQVDRSLLDLAMAPSQAAACVTIDNEVGPDLEAKRGVVLRGPGIATFGGGEASITLEVGSAHSWLGTDASTFKSDPAEDV